MKRFYYTDRKNDGNRKQGNRIINIYKLKNSNLEYITCVTYSTASTRGAQSEAFNALMECGEIPKKWYNSSKSEWIGAGYFYGPVTEVYSIKEIY